MAQKTLGKSDRKGPSLTELSSMSADEESARRWLEGIVWTDSYIEQKS